MSNQKNQFAEAALIEAARHFGLAIDSKESASILIELVDLCKEKGMDVGLRDLAALRAVNSIQPATDSQDERWKPEVGERYWLAFRLVVGSELHTWEGEQIELRWFNENRIRKTEEEALELSAELNRVREATETDQTDSGKDGNITPGQEARLKAGYPAEVPEPTQEMIEKIKSVTESEIIPSGPLRELPDAGNLYVTHAEGTVEKMKSNDVHLLYLEAGRVFENSEAGRLGAERRADQGIQAPIDREELRKRYKKWQNTDGESETPTVDFLIYIQSILEGGQTS